jgi:hypothetical protein
MRATHANGRISIERPPGVRQRRYLAWQQQQFLTELGDDAAECANQRDGLGQDGDAKAESSLDDAGLSRFAAVVLRVGEI